MDALTFIWEP
jgi:hypothetical protein